jgi:hypothetical protein
MKYIKTFESHVNERVEYSSTKMNGNDVVSSWAGSADNEKDFLNMIKDMPETLSSVKVQSNASIAYPAMEEFKGPINASKKNKIAKIVKDVVKMFKDQGDEIVKFELMSYFGVAGKNHMQDPAYIQFRTKKSNQFGKDMASGKYGPLD